LVLQIVAKGRNDAYAEQVNAFAKRGVMLIIFLQMPNNLKVTSALVAGTPPDVCEY
jgi:hypothetical protein